MTTTEEAYIGIDISKAYFDAALRVKDEVLQGRFENSKAGFRSFRKWLKKRHIGEARVCMEATGSYHEALTHFLYEHGFEVSVVNPRRIKAYRESQMVRNKTDKTDALLIEDFCRTQWPKLRLWEPPAPEVVALREMERRVDALHKMRTMEINRLKADDLTPRVAASIQAHIAYIEEEIRELEKAIQEHLDGHSKLKAEKQTLTSITGIGPKTVAVLMGEVGDIHRFTRATELTAYVGVSPQVLRSGATVRGRPGISKMGNARVRKALYFPTLTAMRHNPVIREFSERLLARGKPMKVVIIASMRKLLHIIFGVWKSGQPFDPAYEQRQQAMA